MAVTWEKIAYSTDLHSAVSLAASADVLLGLSTQELSLDNQNVNVVLAGPATGDPAAPTFRSLVDADIPDTITLTNITQIANRSHTNLSDVGTLSHATLDTYLDQAVKQASSPTFAGLSLTGSIGVLFSADSIIESLFKNSSAGTSAASTLTVKNNVNDQMYFRIYGSNATGTFYGKNKAGMSLLVGDGPGGFVISTGSQGAGIFFAAQTTFTTEPQMALLANGNFGIGIVPEAALHVRSASVSRVAILKNSSGAWAAESNILFTTGDPDQGQGSVAWINRDEAATYNSQLQFRTIINNGEPTVRMIITGGGNVGINDIAPGEFLDVNGNINATGVLKVDDVQVVGNQGAHVTDADAGTIVAQFNTLLTRLEAHGLLASA